MPYLYNDKFCNVDALVSKLFIWNLSCFEDRLILKEMAVVAELHYVGFQKILSSNLTLKTYTDELRSAVNNIIMALIGDL